MATISVKSSIKIFCSAVDNNNVIEDNHLSFSFNSQFIFVYASQQVCQCQKFQTHLIYWVATSYLKLQVHFGGFLLISARLFFEVQFQLNPRSIYVFSVKPPGLQNSTQCSKTKGGRLLHPHLPQLVSSCQIKILSLVDYTYLMSRLIWQYFCNLNSLKNFTCPLGKLIAELTSLIAKSTSPALSDTTFFACWVIMADSCIKWGIQIALLQIVGFTWFYRGWHGIRHSMFIGRTAIKGVGW